MTRVTQSMLSTNMLRNLNTSYGKMSKMQDNLTSGMKISRASDDPVVAVKGMKYRTQLDKIDQFKRNMNEAEAWLDTTDTALDQVGSTLNRIKELVVQAANDTNTPEERAKIKVEIDQIREQIKDVANTQVGGKYIFSGTHTQKALYVNVQVPDVEGYYNTLTTDADRQAFLNGLPGTAQTVTGPLKTVRVENTQAGITNPYKSEVFGVPDPNDPTKKITVPSVDLNVTAPAGYPQMTATGLNGTVQIEVFDGIQLIVNTNKGPDVFAAMEKVLKEVSNVLGDPNATGQEIGDKLGSIADGTDTTIADIQAKVLDARADVGARQNRVELMMNRLDIQEINVTKQKSLNEDTDYAETITKMTTQESIHQAALSVGAKIIQQTLVDFIR